MHGACHLACRVFRCTSLLNFSSVLVVLLLIFDELNSIKTTINGSLVTFSYRLCGYLVKQKKNNIIIMKLLLVACLCFVSAVAKEEVKLISNEAMVEYDGKFHYQ